MKTTTTRLGTLPAATLAQRVAALSVPELMSAARALATRTDAASEEACTAVLDKLATRIPADSFEQFVAEIYA